MTANYRELSSHITKKPKVANPRVPDIGQRLSFYPELVVQDKDDQGNLGTPMSKVRWFAGGWNQIGRHEAGMYVFFLNKPESQHTGFIIRSVIPSQTACYAELV